MPYESECRPGRAVRSAQTSYSSIVSQPAGDVKTLERRIRVARGETPGDLFLAGGQVVNVFTRQVQHANVIVADGHIAGVGPYDWAARERIDLEGRFILPSFIDAHMHVESTLLVPGQLARLVVPRGTGTIVADPHEIANVMGTRGVEMLIASSAALPLDIYYMAPSCVPAMSWENAGAVLDAAEIEHLLAHPGVLGLAEMMNFPGVLGGDAEVLAKLSAAARHHAVVDGHAPGLRGRDLIAYAAAGIASDHESTEADEAAARAALGMLVQVREGTMARNLDTMLPLLVEDRLGDWCLCTDDIHPDDLMKDGHIESLLRRVVAAGVEPARAVRHATLVPARHYGLGDRGAVTGGRRADLVAVEDLVDFKPALVIKNGVVVARDGAYIVETEPPAIAPENTVHLPDLDESAFRLDLGDGPCPVIQIVPEQIITRRTHQAVTSNGSWRFDPQTDIVMVACVERHGGTGGVGLALVSGFGFRKHCAIASTVAHDSHNLLIAGTNPADMLACARALGDSGGGFVVAAGGEVKGLLALPVAGLLSTETAEDVVRGLKDIRRVARELGSSLSCPFGTLSFLALSVIPELRITDQGLFDVLEQRFISSKG